MGPVLPGPAARHARSRGHQGRGDRIGYAQTIEQVSGMAWTTGYENGPPLIPRGLCDPLTGLHAAIAVLIALEHRDRSGEGQLVEATMVEAALNIAAEPIVEFSKY